MVDRDVTLFSKGPFYLINVYHIMCTNPLSSKFSDLQKYGNMQIAGK